MSIFTHGERNAITITNQNNNIKPIIKHIGTVNSLDDCNRITRDVNAYFVLGETKYEKIYKKPTKDDMAGSYWAWVDLDLGTEGSYDDKREALALFIINNKWEVVPKPTVILDSGGGFQLLWLMNEFIPYVVESAEAEGETITEQINRWLVEQLHDADRTEFNPDGGCVNVDRIFRLPNTINIPNQGKIDKGYPINGAPTMILEDNGISHDANTFGRSNEKLGKAIRTGKDISEMKGIADLDRSSDKIESTRLLLTASGIPQHWISYVLNFKKPTSEQWKPGPGYTDGHSEYIYAAIIVMASKGLSERDVLLMAISPEFKWSEWFHKKDGGDLNATFNRVTKEYAGCLIIANKNKSEEWAFLDEMNKVYAVYDEGNDFRIIREDSPDGKMHIAETNVWTKATSHMKSKDAEGKNIQHSSAWMRWQGHRKYTKMVFNAKHKWEYELWKGWGVDVPDTCDPVIDEAMNTFFKNLLTEPDQREFFLNIIAYSVQNVGKMTGRMPILFGQKGCGKSFVGSMVHYMFFDYAIKTNVEHSLKRFTGHLENKLCVFFDELTYIDSEAGSKLKDIITSPTLNVEPKGKQVKNVRNYNFFIATADDAKFVYGEKGERRTFAVECTNHYNIKFDDSAVRMNEFMEIMGIIGKYRDDWTRLGDIIAWFKGRKIPDNFRLDTQINSDIIDDNVIVKLPTLYRFWFDIFQANKLPTLIKIKQSEHDLGSNMISADMIIFSINAEYQEKLNRRTVSKFMRDNLELTQTGSRTDRMIWTLPNDLKSLHMAYHKNGGPRIDEDYID